MRPALLKALVDRVAAVAEHARAEEAWHAARGTADVRDRLAELRVAMHEEARTRMALDDAIAAEAGVSR